MLVVPPLPVTELAPGQIPGDRVRPRARLPGQLAGTAATNELFTQPAEQATMDCISRKADSSLGHMVSVGPVSGPWCSECRSGLCLPRSGGQEPGRRSAYPSIGHTTPLTCWDSSRPGSR